MVRNGTLDFARLVAAIGIIVFHVGGPGASVGYAALPFFTMLLVYLAFHSAVHETFHDFAGARTARLLKPWVLWSLVYGTLKFLEIILTGRPFNSEFASWMLLTGPALHLWFLPFSCAACIAVWPIAHNSTWLGTMWKLAYSAIGLTFAAILVEAGDRLTLGMPFAQWLDAVPAVLVGSVLALINTDASKVLLQTLALACLIGILFFLGWPPGSTRLVLATGVLLFCLVFPIPSTQTTRSFAANALTLYLAHPMVISVLLRTTDLAEETLAMAVTAVIGTILFASALRKMGLLVASRTTSA